MIDPSVLDTEGLATVLAQGLISPTDAVLALTERSRDVNPVLNCFAELDERPALVKARLLETGRHVPDQPGTLWGVPYGHKDVFVTPLRWPIAGTRVSPLPLSSGHAAVTTALDREHAVSLGALNLDEISYGATGLNAHYGNCRNPWGLAYITGGSSSGAAAAVAARALPFAVCSDTAGSTRIPASLCGVVGFKPTFGRIDTSGMVPLSSTQDTIGIIARSVRDCGLVMAAMDKRGTMTQRTPHLRTGGKSSTQLDGMRIGICEHAFFDMEIPGGETLLQQAFDVIRRLGIYLSRKPLKDLEDFDAAATIITWVEVLNNYGSCLRQKPDGFAAATRIRLETAIAPSNEDYGIAQGYRAAALNRFMNTAFLDVDFLIAPTVTIPTPTIARLNADPQESVRITTSFLRSNRCFSYLGLPALSIPMGFSTQGLPVGLQIIGKPWRDEDVLRLGAAYQSRTDWHLMAPKIRTFESIHNE